MAPNPHPNLPLIHATKYYQNKQTNKTKMKHTSKVHLQDTGAPIRIMRYQHYGVFNKFFLFLLTSVTHTRICDSALLYLLHWVTAGTGWAISPLVSDSDLEVADKVKHLGHFITEHDRWCNTTRHVCKQSFHASLLSKLFKEASRINVFADLMCLKMKSSWFEQTWGLALHAAHVSCGDSGTAVSL